MPLSTQQQSGSSDQQHVMYMARAIQLAQKGRFTTHPNPRVGCVIVKDGRVIGEGYHQRAGQPHAEINALNSCSESPQGAAVYVTLEPCSHTGKTPPCADALIRAGVAQVIIGMQDPNPLVAGQGAQRLQKAGIDVLTGVLEEQARLLNPGFIKRMEKGLPWVRVKLAMSLDGRTAMASGESQWITGPEARQDVQRLRASADVILTGIGTVLADNPSLNVRLKADALGIEGDVAQPARVVLDTSLQISEQSRLLSLPGDTYIFCRDHPEIWQSAKARKLASAGAIFVPVEEKENESLTTGLALQGVMQTLAKKGFNEVHVEAGATLAGALLQASLVDELVIYMAPLLMGSGARGLLELSGLSKMADALKPDIQDIRAVGADWRIRALVRN